MKRFNWQIWLGFLLSILALFSYPFFFVKFPITRDFPWANLLWFLIAAVLLVIGLRRAFGSDRRRPMLSKLGGAALATLSLLILGLFIFSAFIAARWMPPAKAAPQVGQKAPEFSLVDTNGKTVTLSELTSTPLAQGSQNPKGVLLIFYRGYW